MLCLLLWCSVMNGPIVSIAKELGFAGNSFLEGLVVSIFIGGAFLGSLSCGSLVDKLGCRRTFQLDTIPLILGAIIRLVSQRVCIERSLIVYCLDNDYYPNISLLL